MKWIRIRCLAPVIMWSGLYKNKNKLIVEAKNAYFYSSPVEKSKRKMTIWLLLLLHVHYISRRLLNAFNNNKIIIYSNCCYLKDMLEMVFYMLEGRQKCFIAFYIIIKYCTQWQKSMSNIWMFWFDKGFRKSVIFKNVMDWVSMIEWLIEWVEPCS